MLIALMVLVLAGCGESYTRGCPTSNIYCTFEYYAAERDKPIFKTNLRYIVDDQLFGVVHTLRIC
jgi:hypothetical protein